MTGFHGLLVGRIIWICGLSVPDFNRTFSKLESWDSDCCKRLLVLSFDVNEAELIDRFENWDFGKKEILLDSGIDLESGRLIEDVDFLFENEECLRGDVRVKGPVDEELNWDEERLNGKGSPIWGNDDRFKEEICDDWSDLFEAENLNEDGIFLEENGDVASNLLEAEWVNDEELGRLNLEDEKGALIIEEARERGEENLDGNILWPENCDVRPCFLANASHSGSVKAFFDGILDNGEGVVGDVGLGISFEVRGEFVWAW